RVGPGEPPEAPSMSLIGSLAAYGRINSFGFVETPYRRVVDGRISDQVDYLTADEEDLYVIAQANTPLNTDGSFADSRVLVRRKGGDFEQVGTEEVDY